MIDLKYLPGAKKQSNGTWLAFCPFHDEKSPSFIIQPNGDYHCIGCGDTGNTRDIILACDEDTQ